MSSETSVILKAEELQIIAAISGLKSIALFSPNLKFERSAHVQALVKLIEDGLIIRSGNELRIGNLLAELSTVLNHADRIIVAHLESSEAPPICVYCSVSENLYACITPHGIKPSSYKVYTGAFSDLTSELEQLHFLPSTSSNCDLEPSKFPTEELLSNENIVFQPDLFSTFEKYDKCNNRVYSRVWIVWNTNSWSIVRESIEAGITLHFSPSKFLDWLKE